VRLRVGEVWLKLGVGGGGFIDGQEGVVGVEPMIKSATITPPS
jgi:hypothetical protein